MTWKKKFKEFWDGLSKEEQMGLSREIDEVARRAIYREKEEKKQAPMNKSTDSDIE